METFLASGADHPEEWLTVGRPRREDSPSIRVKRPNTCRDSTFAEIGLVRHKAVGDVERKTVYEVGPMAT